MSGTFNGETGKATRWNGDQRNKDAGRKGGSVKSPAKKYGAKLRAMREAGKNDEQITFFCERLADPEVNIFHIQEQLDKFIESNPKEHNKIAALNTLIQLHKANFGDKRLNQNVNVNVTIEEWEKRLIGDDEEKWEKTN